MSSTTKHYCDICDKELPYNFVCVRILAGDARDFDAKNGAWKYQEGYCLDVCDKCVGSEISRCNGSHGNFSVKDSFRKLLKKLKIIK